ncbi:hypothetical protein ANO11243_065710 [Dothideomycetidae sp. 11243]|nr:hypothetical protein ANO11243_065710 [fungal sp. No.11243]
MSRFSRFQSPSAVCQRWAASSTRASLVAPVPQATSHDTKPSHVRTHASVAGPLVETSTQHSLDPGFASSPTFRWDYIPSDSSLITIPRIYEPPPLRRSVLGHTTADLLQHLLACLRVNRFDRADQIIKRMQLNSETTEAEYMYACEQYIDSRVQSIMSPPGYIDNISELDKWFEDKRLSSREGNEKACLAMIRAAFPSQSAPKRDRFVKRYAEMSGLSKQEILDSDIWTDREYLVVGAILNDQPVPAMQDEYGPQDQQDSSWSGTYNVQDKDIPQVLQVQQRGLSLQYLKQVLQLQEQNRTNSTPNTPLNPEAQVLLDLDRERLIENAAKDAAIAKWKAEDEALRSVGINSVLSSKKMNALMWKWYTELVPVLKKELEYLKARLDTFDESSKAVAREQGDSFAIYLETMTAERLAVVTVIYMVSNCCTGKNPSTEEYLTYYKLSDSAKALGEMVESEVIAKVLSKERGSKWYLKQLRKGIVRSPRLEDSSGNSASALMIKWPLSEKIKIGAMLISKFMEAAKMPITRQHPRTKEKVTRLRSAFSHRNVFSRGKRTAVLSPCPDLRTLMVNEPAGALLAKKLPMVVEPVPWSDFRVGGYLNFPDNFVRMPKGDETPREYAVAAIQKGHMDRVFTAISSLGKTAWRIHEDVLRVQIEAWNTGEAIGGFPPINPDIEYPSEPGASQDPHERHAWLRDVREIDNKKKGWHSQRCHQNLQLEIARSFKDDTIYFPHNVDFRGRAYPLSPYLNHMGADNVRGLMTFATGKELGPNGLRWLKIHLSNVFGYDKDSFQGRENFVMSHLDDIYDSVRNPLLGRKWWLRSDDPWQTLAACFELTAALDSPDPAKFVSHLPIQQDGTCNGLQHYAALGGDAAGARQVNLEPGDKPSDVYTAVAESVIASIKQDLEEGNELAKMLDGKISRKVVKQPVMTNVYGVTYFGARLQVKKQLEDIFPEIQKSDFPNHLTMASYIARKIFNSLGVMFKGAQAIQQWLGTCAYRISTCLTPEQIEAIRRSGLEARPAKAKVKTTTKTSTSSAKKPRRTTENSKPPVDHFKTTVVWTTPLQFPVVQPYRDSTIKPLKTAMSTVLIQEPQAWEPVSKRKQMQAFPPNFIHSLDATHMMLSAMKCDEKGITFASIHDSFWTHACDRDELSELLRDAFVHMHREDIVGRLKEEFEARYKGCMYASTVDKRSRIGGKLGEIRKSDDFQRLCRDLAPGVAASDAEIVVEYERCRLLNSLDPEEQRQGRGMITPSSAFAEEGDASALVETASLGDSALGAAQESNSEDETARCAEDVQSGSDANMEFLTGADDNTEDGLIGESEAPMQHGQAQIPRPDEAGMNKLLGKQAPSRHGKQSALTHNEKTFIWQPMMFPDTPEKGSFDVTRLKQSKYFFH